MSGLTANGFEAKTLNEILEDVKGRLRSSYGSGVETDTDEVVMVTLLPVILELADLWQGAQGQYDFFNKLNAEGISLDNLGAILNIPRLSGIKSVAPMEATGTEGSIIPINFLRSVQDTLEPFQTLQEYVLPAVGLQPFAVSMSALNDGPITSVAGTLNQGPLPSGVATLINTVDATPGTFDETDEEYRIGLGTRLAQIGAGTVVAIKATLRSIPNVSFANVFENDTDVTDVNGVTPHAIKAIVEGGADQDIWDVLGIKKGAGTNTNGTEVGVYTDPTDGQTFPMRFSRPTVVDIYVDVVVTASDATFPVNGLQDIEDALIADGILYDLGDDVNLPRLQGAVTSVPGIVSYTLFFAKTATPLVDTNIVITNDEVAEFDSTRINVT